MSVKGMSGSDLNKQSWAQTLAGSDLWISKKYVEQRTKENRRSSTVLHLRVKMQRCAASICWPKQEKRPVCAWVWRLVSEPGWDADQQIYET